MACFILLTVSASAALLGSAPVNTCREHPRASVIMQANRRSVLAAAACLVLPTKAWAGYALGAAAVAEHSTVATGKAKEQAVYDSVRSSIDAKRPDRPDLGTCASPVPPTQLLPLLSHAPPPFPVAQWATLAESTPRSHRAAASSSSSSWPFRSRRRREEPTPGPRICWVGPHA